MIGIDWSEVSRHRAAGRKLIEHICPVCGETFKGIKIAVYCSAACRQKAKRERRPAP